MVDDLLSPDALAELLGASMVQIYLLDAGGFTDVSDVVAMVASGAVGTQAVAKVRAHSRISMREAAKATITEAMLQAASACDVVGYGDGAGDETSTGGLERTVDDGAGDGAQPAAKVQRTAESDAEAANKGFSPGAAAVPVGAGWRADYLRQGFDASVVQQWADYYNQGDIPPPPLLTPPASSSQPPLLPTPTPPHLTPLWPPQLEAAATVAAPMLVCVAGPTTGQRVALGADRKSRTPLADGAEPAATIITGNDGTYNLHVLDSDSVKLLRRQAVGGLGAAVQLKPREQRTLHDGDMLAVGSAVYYCDMPGAVTPSDRRGRKQSAEADDGPGAPQAKQPRAAAAEPPVAPSVTAGTPGLSVELSEALEKVLAGRPSLEAEYESSLADGDFELFYSYGTGDNDDLSSMSRQYGFEGTALTEAQAARFNYLVDKVAGAYFSSLEHWFHFAKISRATTGAFKEENEGKATGLLRKTPKEAREMTQKGKLRGLDVQAWERDRVAVMRLGMMQQAIGNGGFARRLLSTGDSVLAEAKVSDSFWGIAATAEEARGHSAARRRAWGENQHGRALMAVRAALRATMGDK